MAIPFNDLHWSRYIEVKDYLLPASLPEALDMLAKAEGSVRVISGGTDVIPELRHSKYQAETLVDVTRLPDLSYIKEEDGQIKIGGLVTHAQAAASPLLKEKAGPLCAGCASVGSPQIRNVATLAGNLISGQPAADASIPLVALDAVVTIAGQDGEREVPLSGFFLDVGRTAIDPSKEILTSIQFKALGAGTGASYQRLAKRKALTLPMLVCAVVVELAGKNFKRAAIALGPVAPMPFREKYTEDLLAGKPVSQETIGQATESASAQCSPRDSLLRGSCDYRQEMVKVFVERGLKEAAAAAGCPLD